jgi:autotransporter-associated beta strand protein
MVEKKIRSRFAKNRRRLYAAATAALLSSAPLSATTYTWTSGGADSNWSSAANWVGTIVPVSGPTTDLVFNAPPVTPIQDIRNNFQVQSMKFGPQKYSLTGFSITMSGSALVQCDASLAVTNEIDLVSNTTFTGAGAISLKGIVSDAGGVIKEGTGTLGFEAANTYSGTTSINAGQVIVTNSAALQNSTVSINVNSGLNLFTVSSATLGNLTGGGNWDLHGANVLIGNNNASPLPYTGSTRRIPPPRTGGLQKLRTATLTHSGANFLLFVIAVIY